MTGSPGPGSETIPALVGNFPERQRRVVLVVLWLLGRGRIVVKHHISGYRNRRSNNRAKPLSAVAASLQRETRVRRIDDGRGLPVAAKVDAVCPGIVDQHLIGRPSAVVDAVACETHHLARREAIAASVASRTTDVD